MEPKTVYRGSIANLTPDAGTRDEFAAQMYTKLIVLDKEIGELSRKVLKLKRQRKLLHRYRISNIRNQTL
jgi:hypothetical protein